MNPMVPRSDSSTMSWKNEDNIIRRARTTVGSRVRSGVSKLYLGRKLRQLISELYAMLPTLPAPHFAGTSQLRGLPAEHVFGPQRGLWSQHYRQTDHSAAGWGFQITAQVGRLSCALRILACDCAWAPHGYSGVRASVTKPRFFGFGGVVGSLRTTHKSLWTTGMRHPKTTCSLVQEAYPAEFATMSDHFKLYVTKRGPPLLVLATCHTAMCDQHMCTANYSGPKRLNQNLLGQYSQYSLLVYIGSKMSL